MNMKKVAVYFRLVVVLLAFVIIVTFMFSNFISIKVMFLKWTLWEGPLFILMFAMGNLGVLVFLVSKRIRKTVVDIRKLRQEEKARQIMIDQIKKETQTSKPAPPGNKQQPEN